MYTCIHTNCIHTRTNMVSDIPAWSHGTQDMVLIPRSALSGDIWLPVLLGDEVDGVDFGSPRWPRIHCQGGFKIHYPTLTNS